MLRVGLTGGIGSGKTAVSDAFRDLGVCVVDADVIAHRVTRAGHPVLAEITDRFGPRALDPDGNLDRAWMRGEVFARPERRRLLEELLHPVIRREMEVEVAQCRGSYCVLVIPLLIESGNTARVDRILVVDAEDDRRRQWIRQRSGLDDAEIDRIFAAQASRERKLAAADDVIVNDGNLDDLVRKTAELDLAYRKLAG